MKLQPLILSLSAFVLCIIVLYVAWLNRTKKACLYTSHQVQLLNRSCRLCLLFLISGVLVSLLIAILTRNIHEVTIKYSYKYIFGQGAYNDSWWPIEEAIEQIREHPDTPVYREIFFKKKIKLQYPPSAFLFLDLPQRMTGFSWAKLETVINIICWFCVLGIGIVFYDLLARASLPPGIKKNILPISSFTLLVFVSLAAVGSFYPILWSYFIGQIQTPITLVIGLALVAWQRRKFGLAGFFIGLCCVIKPQWIVIVLWAIFRRQWRMVIISLITVGIFLSLSIAVYGVNNLVDYLSVLSFLSKHGESFYPNQSVNGLANRFLFNGNNIYWVPDAFPLFHPVVYALTIASSILILGVAMFWRMRKDPSIFDFALIMLSLTIASPIAWEHHYGILLPIFAIVLPTSISHRPLGVWTTAYLWISFLLTSQKLDGITNYFANTHWNVLQSYLFFGAMMVLLLLYRISYFQQSTTKELRGGKVNLPPKKAEGGNFLEGVIQEQPVKCL